jgi:hypothetical protein
VPGTARAGDTITSSSSRRIKVLKHPLRVTCAPTLAARWLVPRLATYQTLPGSNAIAMDASQGLSVPGFFDVAIRSGVGPWPDCESVGLLPEQGTPMLSPKWVPAGSRITVRKLLRIPLIPDHAGGSGSPSRGFRTRSPFSWPPGSRTTSWKRRLHCRGSARLCCHPCCLRNSRHRAPSWLPFHMRWKGRTVIGCGGRRKQPTHIFWAGSNRSLESRRASAPGSSRRQEDRPWTNRAHSPPEKTVAGAPGPTAISEV